MPRRLSRALKATESDVRIAALEPATSPMITAGHAGPHRVEGTAPGFAPPMETKPVRWPAVWREEGVFAGTSTGLHVVAALQLARELGAGRRVATVAVDTGLEYVAGDPFG